MLLNSVLPALVPQVLAQELQRQGEGKLEEWGSIFRAGQHEKLTLECSDGGAQRRLRLCMTSEMKQDIAVEKGLQKAYSISIVHLQNQSAFSPQGELSCLGW